MPSSHPITIKLKSTTSISSHPLTLPPTSTVSALKSLAEAALPSSTGTYLRLIAGGKILEPDGKLLSELGVADGCFVHAVVAKEQARSSRSQTVPSPTGFADSSDEGESDEEAPLRRRGFDELRSSRGLSRQEVTAIRTYFAGQVTAHSIDRPERLGEPEEGETEAEERYRLEEEWMAEQGLASEFAINVGLSAASSSSLSLSRALASPSSPLPRPSGDGRTDSVASVSLGTDRDFAWGFIMGFFVGFFLLFWIWMPSITHKQKMGIVAGMAAQVLVGMSSKGTVL